MVAPQSILGFDTATAACTVGIDHGTRIDVEHRVVDREHNQLLLSMIETLVGAAGLDAVAFGRGPGSFTGVRIAAGVAQGIALARNLPVILISTLATIAAGVFRQDAKAERVLVCTVATRDEIYTACYQRGEDGMPLPLADERVVARSSFAFDPAVRGVVIAGDAAPRIMAAAATDEVRLADWQHPHAYDLLRLARVQLAAGDHVDAAHAVPVYLEGISRFRKETG